MTTLTNTEEDAIVVGLEGLAVTGIFVGLSVTGFKVGNFVGLLVTGVNVGCCDGLSVTGWFDGE